MKNIRNKILASGIALLCSTSVITPIVAVAEGETTAVTETVAKGIAIEALDEKGNDVSNGMVDIGDIITYKIHFDDAMGKNKIINIYMELDDNLHFVNASDSGLIVKKNGKKYVTWHLDSNDEDGVVTLKTKVISNSYGKKITANATIVSQDASYTSEQVFYTQELTNYVWKLPNMSVIDSEGNSIANTKIERDATAYYWIGVDNPTDTEQTVTIKAPLDRRFMINTAAVADGKGGKQYSDGNDHYFKWTLKLAPGEHNAVGYSLYVPRLEDDVFLYSKAYVTFNDLNGAYNTKETNIVNVTLGHQVGVDENNTGYTKLNPDGSKDFGGLEKTQININRETARIKDRQIRRQRVAIKNNNKISRGGQ